MARIDSDARVARKPDDSEHSRIASEAGKGSDAALSARDRRNRPRISPRTDYAAGAVVKVRGEPGEEKRVIGPGRGEGWILLAWIDDSADVFGTYHESQVTT